MQSIVTIVSNIVYLKVAKGVNLKSFHHKKKIVTIYSDESQICCGDHYVMYTNIKALCCIPETRYTTLYVNFTKKIYADC